MKQIIHVDVHIGSKRGGNPSAPPTLSSPAEWQHFSQISLYAPQATQYATPHYLSGAQKDPSEDHFGTLSEELKLLSALEWLIYQHSNAKHVSPDEHLHGLPPKE